MHELSGPLIALIILYAVSSMLSNRFLTFENQIVIFLMFIPIALLALGEAPIIIMGSIDLSPGSIMGLVAVSTAYLIVFNNFSIETAILIGLGIGALAGFINGILVTKGKLPSFVVTLASLMAGRGLVYIITGGYSISGGNLYQLGIFIHRLYGVPLLIWLLLPIIVIYYIFLRYTTLGLYAYAIGGNEDAVRYSGVNADIVKIIMFTVAGFLYGVGGIFVLGQLQSGYANIGYGYELSAIASCVLGGISLAGGVGSPLGPIVGAMILTLIQNILILLGVNPFYQWVVTGVVLVLAGAALTRGVRYVK
ncbi:MAG: ABC transporter permease [Desulfurococcaceae archaeon]|nr:ABC transporter permease [Desulfurococcaceae archaeon]